MANLSNKEWMEMTHGERFPELYTHGIKFKPCPFCGGEPELNVHALPPDENRKKYKLPDYRKYFMGCPTCHFYGMQKTSGEKDPTAAIEWWNTRYQGESDG